MAIINGTNDPETLNGTPGDDVITGLRGNDILRGGAGNDAFVWNPGDGSDTIDGQAGFDVMQFNGANINEQFVVSAIGHHAQFTRDVAAIVMDTDNVERIELDAKAGADTLTIDDLGGTSVRQIAVDLGALDGAVDTVIANGAGSGDSFNVTFANGIVTVVGAHETTTIADAEFADHLVVNGLGGNDTINAAGLPAAALQLTLDGGAGDDKITGGQGADLLIGGDGNDTVTGGSGGDVALLGAGDDRFIWRPGDGSDVVEGQSGFDTLQFDGSNATENMQLFANGGRALLTRDVGNITMDINDVERVEIHAAGGTDTVTVGDLTGTGVKQVAISLSNSVNSGVHDSALDTVVVQGTQAADAIHVASKADELTVTGLAAAVDITHTTSNDILTINGLGGDDVIDAGGVGAGRMHLQLNGGAGNDTLIGGDGSDFFNGGQGSDVILAGAGDDKMVWNPGDGSDIIEGQAGFDTLTFNGANINEHFDISANGDRIRMTRDVAAITMDLHGLERIELDTKGGTDTITINDLHGTGVKQVALNLGSSIFGGDEAVDNVVINTGNGNDHLVVTQLGDLSVDITGLPETINIAHAESIDSLTINGLDGNDTIDASQLGGSVMNVTIDGGAGNDVIFGSGGIDSIFGGAGNDTVYGNQSGDIVDLGTGDDTFVWEMAGGNDLVEGGDGFDTLKLMGAASDDPFSIFANGSRLSIVTTDNAHLDVNGIEQIVVATGAGKDSVTIGDLSGTTVKNVTVDLGAGSNGESVTLNAAAAETMLITTKGNHTVITNENTFQTVTIDNADGNDVLNITAAPGNVPGEVVLAGDLAMSLHFIGGAGADTIISGSGNDFVDGNQGNDVALLGAGNDTYQWDPGDGSDTVDGQAGFDTLHFNGSNIGERIEIVGNGSLAELTRNVANIAMHLNNVERIEFNALGGADTIHVNDMHGSVVKEVAIDLAGTIGGTSGDGAQDIVTVEGSAGNDHVTVTGTGPDLTIAGLTATVTVSHGDSADIVTLNGNDGNDTIDASGLQAGVIGKLTIDGGNGDDTITGGHGSDLIFGGDGHDILKGNDGNDTLDGASGDDVLTGGQGDDTIITGDGHDTITYDGALDGHDLVVDFAGGQDKLDLTKLFDNLGVDAGDRAGRVSIIDHGNGTVDVAVDVDGNKGNGFEQTVATLQTHDPINLGQEVVVHH